MRNNYYFDNIPIWGELKLRYNLIYMDTPVLFVCSNLVGKLFICLNVEYEKRWIIAPTSLANLRAMFEKKFTMEEMFTLSSTGCVVTRAGHSKRAKDKYEFIKCKDFLASDLPAKGAYFLSAEGDLDSFMNEFKI